MTRPVTLDIQNGIAKICFDRPDRMNVIDVEMVEAFETTVARSLMEKSVRVIPLTGNARCFIAGGDLASFRASDDKPALARAIIVPMHRAITALAAAPQISVTGIHGPVAGAGMSLALATDLCLAAEGTTLNLAYQKVAVPADCGATRALSRIVGHRKALEIALLSETFDAAEACRLGIVNRIVPADRLIAELDSLASRLAAGSAQAQARVKSLIRNSLAHDLADQLDEECAAFAECAGSDDFTEALEAFFRRRAPEFSGR